MTIPPRFQYLASVATRYGVDVVQVEDPRGNTFDRNKFIATLSPHDIAELAHIYLEIERRQDAKELTTWILDDGPKAEGMPRRVFLLFILFKALRKKGIEPFARGTVSLVDPEPPRFDWSKLPSSLAFLAVPAEQYGRYQFPAEVDQFFDTITPEQLRELKLLMHRCEANKRAVLDFLELPISKHPESAYVYFLLGILDHPIVSGTEE